MDEPTCQKILWSETRDWRADSTNLNGLGSSLDEVAKAIWQADGRGFSPPSQPTVTDLSQPAALAAWQACAAAVARVQAADRVKVASPPALFLSSADPAADNAERYPWLGKATPVRRAGPFQVGGFGKYVWVYAGRDANSSGRFPRDTDPVVGVDIAASPTGLLERLGERSHALAFGVVVALFVVAFGIVGWFAYNEGTGRGPTYDLTAEWVAAGAAIIALIGLSGDMAGRGLMGAMVDTRNRLSLSLVQVAGWSVLVLSLFYVTSMFLLGANSANRAKLTLPSYGEGVWALLGISVASAGLSQIILASKDLRSSLASGAAAETGGATLSSPLDKNDDPRDWSFFDLIMGEEVANAESIDVSRLQQLVITIILMIVFAGGVLQNLSEFKRPPEISQAVGVDKPNPVEKTGWDEWAAYQTIPNFLVDPHDPKQNIFLQLLLFSHAGYLASKLVRKTAPAKSTDSN